MPRRAITALAGAIAMPAAVPPQAVPPAAPPPSLAAALAPRLAAEVPFGAAGPFRSDECLASTICSVKARVRWRTAAWSPDFCREIAAGVTAAARRHDLSPTLLLAVMLNESDLDEKAALPTMHGERIYAKDSGLMGVRCVLDRRGRCRNGNVRGMSWEKLMDPLTNIEVGARELASWRKGGVSRVTVRVRDASGELVLKEKKIPCQHRTHAFWAHYNHGPVYLDHGPARHYPHRVAVLDYALAEVMDLPAPEIEGPLADRITIRDPGQRQRTPDRPVEARFRKLCAQIREAAGSCARGVAALPAAPALDTTATR